MLLSTFRNERPNLGRRIQLLIRQQPWLQALAAGTCGLQDVVATCALAQPANDVAGRQAGIQREIL